MLRDVIYMKRLIAVSIIALACAACQRPRQTAWEGQNPFSPPTYRISLAGLSGKEITVTLFDLAGKEVGIVFQGIVDSSESVDITRLVKITADSLSAPDTTIVFMDNLPGGVYFYRVKTAESSYTKQLVVVR